MIDFDIILQYSPNIKLRNEVSFWVLAANMGFGSTLGGLGEADICPRWLAAAGEAD